MLNALYVKQLLSSVLFENILKLRIYFQFSKLFASLYSRGEFFPSVLVVREVRLHCSLRSQVFYCMGPQTVTPRTPGRWGGPIPANTPSRKHSNILYENIICLDPFWKLTTHYFLGNKNYILLGIAHAHTTF